ncbi:HNH endonuclease [Massilia aurea]|uniref:HNH endonuclease n=1 Tax=Massilia aurea TaxID=373040 RepID=UPI000F2DE371|nr:HNH endonuclease [Massilia aurea]
MTTTTPLDPAARRILALLVNLIRSVKTADPRTYIGYMEVHHQLGLSMQGLNWGVSLKNQGLEALAHWCLENNVPAITGLIINKDPDKMEPGIGYYQAFGRRNDDVMWWMEQMRESKSFDWNPYVETQENQSRPAAPTLETPLAADVNEVPPRIETTTYRILRDTQLAKIVKALHNYECQVCGETISLRNGERYAEAHHIQPLGAPHNGPDRFENIVCLCPNHHVEFDYGVCEINLSDLRQAPTHQVDPEYVRYHNQRIWNKSDK